MAQEENTSGARRKNALRHLCKRFVETKSRAILRKEWLVLWNTAKIQQKEVFSKSRVAFPAMEIGFGKGVYVKKSDARTKTKSFL